MVGALFSIGAGLWLLKRIFAMAFLAVQFGLLGLYLCYVERSLHLNFEGGLLSSVGMGVGFLAFYGWSVVYLARPTTTKLFLPR